LITVLLLGGVFWLAACNTNEAVTPSVVKVVIDQPDQTIEAGSSVNLTAKVTVVGGASKAVTWASSDTAIATVTNAGVVTGVAAGTATITATSVGKPTKTDSINVVVTEAGGPSVVSVEIDQPDQSIEVGQYVTLTATVTVIGGATTDVTWASSNTAVATVSGAGLVSGVATGTATITATSVGTPTRTDSIEVTVTPAGTPGDVQIVSFAGSVTTGSQAAFTWSTLNATSVTLYAVNPSDEDDEVTLGAYTGADVGATVALPDSDHQAYRLEAAGAGGPVSEKLPAFANVVVNNQDYDVYNLRGFTPEPSVPGSLRNVLATAPTGSVIGFASNITQIEVYGVDIFDSGGTAIDGHLIPRNDVTISGPVGAPVLLQAISAHDVVGGPGDPFTYGSRVFFIPSGVTATLENLTITGGSFIYSGSGIQNAGTLTVRNCIITDNRAFGSGGGIRSTIGSTLTIEDSVISNNQAITLDSEIDHPWEIRGTTPAVTFGGVNGWGAGLYNDGIATVTNTEITDNTARQGGGGIYNTGTLTLTNSTVSGNTADHVTGYTQAGANDYSEGGGIANYGTLTVTGGSVTGNLSADQGGGVFQHANGLAEITNVTITGNTAGVPSTTGFGGGIMQHYYTGEMDSNLTLTGGTLSGNVPQDILRSDDGARTTSLGLGTVDPSALPEGVRLEGNKYDREP